MRDIKFQKRVRDTSITSIKTHWNTAITHLVMGWEEAAKHIASPESQEVRPDLEICGNLV